MGIQKDAGELLGYIYEQYTKTIKPIKAKDIIDETKWEADRINRAILYLRDSEVIKVALPPGNIKGVYNFGIRGLTPQGIDIIENKQKFKSTFGFEIGIPGMIRFSWRGERR